MTYDVRRTAWCSCGVRLRVRVVMRYDDLVAVRVMDRGEHDGHEVDMSTIE